MLHNISCFIKDYLQRTKENYESLMLLKANQGNSETIHEVTHLVNSLFGVLIVPFEAFSEKNDKNGEKEKMRQKRLIADMKSSKAYNKIEKIIIECICSNNYTYKYSYDKSKILPFDSVYFFIYRLRNSLAHGGKQGLSFIPVSHNSLTKDITHVIFHDNRGGSYSYIKLSVEQLLKMLIYLCELYMSIDQELAFSEKDYDDRITNAEKAMSTNMRTIAFTETHNKITTTISTKQLNVDKIVSLKQSERI